MDPALEKDRYRRLTSHFERCIELSPALQQEYLDRVALDDPDLVTQLKALLHQYATRIEPTTPHPAPLTDSRPAARPRRRKVTFGIALLVVGILILFIILVGQVWALGLMENTLRRQSGCSLRTALDLRVSELRHWAKERKAHARRIFEDPRLAESAAALAELARDADGLPDRLKSSPSSFAAAGVLRKAMTEAGDLGFAILSPAGTALCSDGAEIVGRPVAQDRGNFIRRINLGGWILSRPQPDGDLFVGETADFKRPVLYAGGPILSKRGEVIALGLIKIDAKPIQAMLASPTLEFLAFDEKGLLLNEISRTEPLRKAGLLPASPETGSAFRIYLRDPGDDLRRSAISSVPVDQWPATLMSRSAAQGVDGLDTSGQRDLRGQPVLQSWSWLPEWEMGVGVQWPEEVALAALSPIRTALWISAGVFAVVGIILYLLARKDRARRFLPGEPSFGSYVVDRRIGHGATAEIFLAHHAYLKRPAALKILSETHPSQESIDRFEREARLASRLGHPNTIQVFDYGEAPDGRLFMAMEYVQGLNLAQLITLDSPLPIARVVHILKQIAGALDEAHVQGLLHRDLKPSNIMIGCRGGIGDVVKVLDFGIAAQVSGAEEDATKSSAVVGTPAFIAPERIRTPLVMDPRSDIYSFGAVAFHLITGRHVFESGGPEELVYQVLTSTRPSPSQLRGERIPAELEDLVLDCLSVGPASRPPTFRTVRERLKAIRLSERWGRDEARAWWTLNRDRVDRFGQALS